MNSLRLKVKVVPGASSSKIVGWLGDVLKIRIAEPPEKGRANKALVAILAKQLDLGEKSISIVGGSKSHYKDIKINGLTRVQLIYKLSEC